MCQQHKKHERKCGELQEKTETALWNAACVDLADHRAVETDKGDKSSNFLEPIDHVACWVELLEIQNKSAEEVALKFDKTWLTRHPRPNYCMFDKRSEFTGQEF